MIRYDVLQFLLAAQALTIAIVVIGWLLAYGGRKLR